MALETYNQTTDDTPQLQHLISPDPVESGLNEFARSYTSMYLLTGEETQAKAEKDGLQPKNDSLTDVFDDHKDIEVRMSEQKPSLKHKHKEIFRLKKLANDLANDKIVISPEEKDKKPKQHYTMREHVENLKAQTFGRFFSFIGLRSNETEILRKQQWDKQVKRYSEEVEGASSDVITEFHLPESLANKNGPRIEACVRQLITNQDDGIDGCAYILTAVYNPAINFNIREAINLADQKGKGFHFCYEAIKDIGALVKSGDLNTKDIAKQVKKSKKANFFRAFLQGEVSLIGAKDVEIQLGGSKNKEQKAIQTKRQFNMYNMGTVRVSFSKQTAGADPENLQDLGLMLDWSGLSQTLSRKPDGTLDVTHVNKIFRGFLGQMNALKKLEFFEFNTYKKWSGPPHNFTGANLDQAVDLDLSMFFGGKNFREIKQKVQENIRKWMQSVTPGETMDIFYSQAAIMLGGKDVDKPPGIYYARSLAEVRSNGSYNNPTVVDAFHYEVAKLGLLTDISLINQRAARERGAREAQSVRASGVNMYGNANRPIIIDSFGGDFDEAMDQVRMAKTPMEYLSSLDQLKENGDEAMHDGVFAIDLDRKLYAGERSDTENVDQYDAFYDIQKILYDFVARQLSTYEQEQSSAADQVRQQKTSTQSFLENFREKIKPKDILESDQLNELLNTYNKLFKTEEEKEKNNQLLDGLTLNQVVQNIETLKSSEDVENNNALALQIENNLSLLTSVNHSNAIDHLVRKAPEWLAKNIYKASRDVFDAFYKKYSHDGVEHVQAAFEAIMDEGVGLTENIAGYCLQKIDRFHHIISVPKFTQTKLFWEKVKNLQPLLIRFVIQRLPVTDNVMDNFSLFPPDTLQYVCTFKIAKNLYESKPKAFVKKILQHLSPDVISELFKKTDLDISNEDVLTSLSHHIFPGAVYENFSNTNKKKYLEKVSPDVKQAMFENSTKIYKEFVENDQVAWKDLDPAVQVKMLNQLNQQSGLPEKLLNQIKSSQASHGDFMKACEFVLDSENYENTHFNLLSHYKELLSKKILDYDNKEVPSAFQEKIANFIVKSTNGAEPIFQSSLPYISKNTYSERKAEIFKHASLEAIINLFEYTSVDDLYLFVQANSSYSNMVSFLNAFAKEVPSGFGSGIHLLLEGESNIGKRKKLIDDLCNASDSIQIDYSVTKDEMMKISIKDYGIRMKTILVQNWDDETIKLNNSTLVEQAKKFSNGHFLAAEKEGFLEKFKDEHALLDGRLWPCLSKEEQKNFVNELVDLCKTKSTYKTDVLGVIIYFIPSVDKKHALSDLRFTPNVNFDIELLMSFPASTFLFLPEVYINSFFSHVLSDSKFLTTIQNSKSGLFKNILRYTLDNEFPQKQLVMKSIFEENFLKHYIAFSRSIEKTLTKRGRTETDADYINLFKNINNESKNLASNIVNDAFYENSINAFVQHADGAFSHVEALIRLYRYSQIVGTTEVRSDIKYLLNPNS